MAHGLRALAADAEDLGLVPSTTRGVHKHHQLLFQDLCRSTGNSYTYTQQDTHTHRIEINKFLKQRVFS